MHEFKYKQNELYCENVSVRDVARRFPTPFYLYSHRTLIDHYTKIKEAFSSVRPLICFSMKANSNLAIVRTLVKRGAGLDIVSGGELYKAKKAGVDTRKVVFAGVGKTEQEIRYAIESDILFFNAESAEELELLDEIAFSYRRVLNVALRLNPDIKPKTHRYIATGMKETKFGMGFGAAKKIFERRHEFPSLLINGIHVHIGSQITEGRPFVMALKKVLRFIDTNKLKIEWLNIGGGLGIVYAKEQPQTAKEFARKILPLLKGRSLKLILEPGRFIVGNSGILVTKVLYTKQGANRNFVIVDAGMNDFIRPSIYGAYHEILPVVKPTYEVRRPMQCDVVGPICESGDFLGKNRKMFMPHQGELFAVMGAGAYGFSMASNYNARPKIAELMVVKGGVYIVRRPQKYDDLVRDEFIPRALK